MVRSSDEQSREKIESVPATDARATWFHALVDGWKDPIACGVLGLLGLLLLLIVNWESTPRQRLTPHVSIRPESVQNGRRG